MVFPSNASIISTSNEPLPNDVIRLYYQNVNGLRTKSNLFRLASQLCDYKIIVLTETGLTESIFDTEIFDSNFIVYRCDRTPYSSEKTRKGGVLVAVHSALNSFLIKSGEICGIEQIWVKVRIDKSNLLNIGAFYIPPRAKITQYQYYVEFVEGVMDKIIDTEMCYLIGDFNLPNIVWQLDDDSNNILMPINVSDECEACVVDSLFGLDLLQKNGIQNSKNRILDLVFTNNYENSNVNIASDCLLPDEVHHKALELSIYIIVYANKKTNIKSTQPSLNFKKANYDILNQFFTEIDWDSTLYNVNVDNMVTRLYNAIENGIIKFVPQVNRINGRRKTIEDRALNNLKHRQKKAHRRYIDSNRSREYYTIFAQVRREYNHLKADLLRINISKTENALKSNPSNFFNFVNERRKTNSFPSVMKFNTKTASNSDEIVNLFAEYFSTVYTSHGGNNNLLLDCKNPSLMIPKLTLTENDVCIALEKLPETLDRGSDKLPAIFLKRCAKSLAKPLCLIFNESLAHSTFPSCWKISNIKPLHSIVLKVLLCSNIQ